PEQRLREIDGNRRQPRAFEDLAAMEGEARVVTLHDRHGCEYHVVAGAARDDDVGAGGERLDEGLDTHLRDDGPAAVDDFGGQRLRTQAVERRLAQPAL